MNFLFCSVGRRGEFIKNIRQSLDKNSRVIATDCCNTAPALFFADQKYIVPKITSSNYIPTILEICKMEKIEVITTLIDPEIEILAKNRELFEKLGIKVLAPDLNTTRLCFDKFEMYKHFVRNNIKTIKTYCDFNSFDVDFINNKINFPVFVKPRTGSGSVGARKVISYEELTFICAYEKDLIIQEFMDGTDIDADVYIDTISHKAVSIFTKRKMETKLGGASKTISFKDNQLFDLIPKIVSTLTFSGPIDIDLFYKEGEYFVSEINPRFGGAYLHAYGCGVDFIKLIINNVEGNENQLCLNDYEDDIMMLMYDSVVITKYNY